MAYRIITPGDQHFKEFSAVFPPPGIRTSRRLQLISKLEVRTYRYRPFCPMYPMPSGVASTQEEVHQPDGQVYEVTIWSKLELTQDLLHATHLSAQALQAEMSARKHSTCLETLHVAVPGRHSNSEEGSVLQQVFTCFHTPDTHL